jgi:hypothetical protein
VTDHPAGGGGPVDRLLITIASLDLTDTGTAQLTADWLLIPSNPTSPASRGRLSLHVQGPVATDADVVALGARLLTQLAGASTSRACAMEFAAYHTVCEGTARKRKTASETDHTE